MPHATLRVCLSSHPNSRCLCPASIIAFAHILLAVDPTSPVPPSALVPLGLAGYSLPLATNVMATGLIVGKLLWMIRSPIVAVGESAPIFTSGYGAVRHAAEIIVESGALYLAVQLIFVVLFAMGHPAQAIFAVIAVQIYVSVPFLCFWWGQTWIKR